MYATDPEFLIVHILLHLSPSFITLTLSLTLSQPFEQRLLTFQPSNSNYFSVHFLRMKISSYITNFSKFLSKPGHPLIETMSLFNLPSIIQFYQLTQKRPFFSPPQNPVQAQAFHLDVMILSFPLVYNISTAFPCLL